LENLHVDTHPLTYQKIFPKHSIIFRNDADSRRFEGLENYVKIAVGEMPAKIEIEENNLKFVLDFTSGQKTGWFFDQRKNKMFSKISK
jgi:23S rRNA (cytosine1962-C5)-methyltransferase